MTPHRNLIDATIVDPATPPSVDTLPTYDFLQPTIVVLSILTIFILIAIFRRKNNILCTRLAATESQLKQTETELHDLRCRLNSTLEFQKSLKEAEITTKLQKPRLSVQTSAATIQPPERYRYVKSLADNGMPPEEIASVLSISAHEANQLVNLSRLVSI